jgi:hypothetical protein
MQPHLQRIESEPSLDLDDQLTVKDEPLCGERTSSGSGKSPSCSDFVPGLREEAASA